MEPRIILSRADFSANNIGRYIELSELTKKVLAKQTQYVEGDTEAVALNDFLNNLTSGGFIGGENPLLYGLFIPALAASHDELLYNLAKLDESGYPVIAMTDAEINAAELNKALVPIISNERIIGFTSNDVDTATNYKLQSVVRTSLLSDKVGEYIPNFSVCTYLLEAPGNNAFMLESTSVNYKFRFNSDTTYIYQNSPNTNSVTCSISGNSKLNAFSGVSYKVAETFEGILDFGTIGSPTISGTPSSLKVQDNFGSFVLGDQSGIKPKYGFIAAGNYISTENMTILKTQVDTLLTALHAI